jgi:hypothetical protein
MGDANQGLRAWVFSVPKNPDIEHVILNSIQNLFDDWQSSIEKIPHRGELSSPCAE